MSGTHTRTRALSRAVLLLLVIVIGPALLLWVGLVFYNATRARQVVVHTEPPSSDLVTVRGVQYPGNYRPVVETEYREETVKLDVPEIDPETGETVVRERQQVVKVPVQRTRWVLEMRPHDPNVQKLVNELKAMDEDGQERDAKLKQLRQRLELEFMQMHENQAKQIETTEERLEALKKLHQERGENKDKIVQRRIDEMMGKADSLQWNPVPSAQTSPSYRSGSYADSQVRTYGAPIDLSTPPHMPGYSPQASKSNRSGTTTTPHITWGPTQQFSHSKSAGQPNADNVARDPRLPRATMQVPSTLSSPAVPSTSQFQATVAGPPGGNSTRNEVASTTRSNVVRQSADTRVETSTAVTSRLFDLARKSARAEAELAALTPDLEQLRRLQAEGALPESEVQKAELKVEQLRREVELNKIELDAMKEAIGRDLELARAALRAEDKQDNAERRFNAGVETDDQFLEAKYEVVKAQSAFENARSNLQQLERAFMPLDETETAEEIDDGDGDPLGDEQETESDASADGS